MRVPAGPAGNRHATVGCSAFQSCSTYWHGLSTTPLPPPQRSPRTATIGATSHANTFSSATVTTVPPPGLQVGSQPVTPTIRIASVGDVVGDALGLALGDALGAVVGDELGDVLGANVGPVGLTLGLSEGACVGLLGDAEGAIVGSTVGCDGETLGLALGRPLGESEGCVVGAALGAIEGSVGDSVGAGVSSAVHVPPLAAQSIRLSTPGMLQLPPSKPKHSLNIVMPIASPYSSTANTEVAS